MSITLDRLQRLRTQAGLVTTRPTPASSTDELSVDVPFLKVLMQRRALRSHLDGVDRSLPGDEIAPGLRLIESCIDWLDAPDVVDTRFDPRATCAIELAPQDVLAFDTETTGLAGGTGTRAFMIGAADWHHNRVRIRQLLITQLSAEAAMLDCFASWLNDTTVLVSYNGKSYDAPLLAARYRLSRMRNPLAGRAHLDLLHPSRRRWRGHYENCRLATIEREVLGVVREDDLPGSEAPAAWLDYLRGGGARNLRRVAVHNHTDVVSLLRLLRHLAQTSG